MGIGDDLAAGPVRPPALLLPGFFGFLGNSCFGLVAVRFLSFFLLGLVAVFPVLGVCVSCSVRFPGVSFPAFFFFRLSGFWRFLSLPALLHLASFSLRLGKEHLPVLPAAMDPDPLWPCTCVFRVTCLLLGVVPGTRWCTAGGVCGIHCDPLHDHHHCHLSPR